MIPHGGAELGGGGDPELRATAEGDGVVVEHRGNDEGAVEDGGDDGGVLELPDLIAETAVGGVP